MKVIVTSTWREKAFFVTPIIAYNGKDKELLIAFICFAILINFKSK